MTDERWQDIIAHVKDNFELLDHQTQDFPAEAGPGSVEVLEFKGPLGRIKLEWTTQPLVIDKKTIGSRRIGSDTTVEYKYSDTEKVHRFKAFRFDEGVDAWVEIELEKGNMIF